MAAIGLHAAIVTSDVWAADLVTAGVAPVAAAVYDGRRPQGTTRTDREVWIEAQPGEPFGRGMQDLDSYPYLVHVRVATPGNAGANRTGAEKSRAVIGFLDTIRDRYHAKRPFLSTLPEIKFASAVIETIDTDPLDTRVIDGTIRVTFYATATQPSAFPQPTAILGSSLVAWFDASDASTITSDTDGVSSWSNKVVGGSPSTVDQAVDARKPAVGVAAVNGLNTLVGTGSTDNRFISSSTLPVTGPPFFAWIVLKKAAATSGVPFALSDLSSSGALPSWRVELSPGGNLKYTAEDSGTSVTVQPSTTQGNAVPVLMELEETATNDRAAVFQADDANEATDSTAVDPEGTGLVDHFSLLALVRNSGSVFVSPLDGDLCEVLVADAIPSAAQKTDIRNYLEDKWGITLL